MGYRLTAASGAGLTGAERRITMRIDSQVKALKEKGVTREDVNAEINSRIVFYNTQYDSRFDAYSWKALNAIYDGWESHGGEIAFA